MAARHARRRVRPGGEQFAEVAPDAGRAAHEFARVDADSHAPVPRRAGRLAAPWTTGLPVRPDQRPRRRGPAESRVNGRCRLRACGPTRPGSVVTDSSAAASALTSAGSIRMPASPTTSGRAPTVGGHDGDAQRHGLECRQPESLVERRQHDQAGSRVELGAALVRDVAFDDHPPLEGRRLRLGHPGVGGGRELAGKHERRRAGLPLDEEPVGGEQHGDVLARLERAHEQQVAAKPWWPVRQGAGDPGGHARPADRNPLRGHREPALDLRLRVLRDGHHQVGAGGVMRGPAWGSRGASRPACGPGGPGNRGRRPCRRAAPSGRAAGGASSSARRRSVARSAPRSAASPRGSTPRRGAGPGRAGRRRWRRSTRARRRATAGRATRNSRASARRRAAAGSPSALRFNRLSASWCTHSPTPVRSRRAGR